MSMKRMKHLLVLCLALVMVVGLLSVTALADDSMQITFSQGDGAYYFPGDELTVTVTGSFADFAPQKVTLNYDEKTVLAPVGDPVCDETTYTQTYRVAKITGNYCSVTFNATYASEEGESIAPASETIGMNLRNQLTVTLFDAGQPLSGAAVVLHYAYDNDSKNLTLTEQSPGTYVTNMYDFTIDGYDYVSVTAPGNRTATITKTTSGDLMSAIYAGESKLVASYAFEGYTVSFASNGGSPVASQKVAYGGYAKEPAAPTLEGYTFLGWYAGNKPFVFETTPIISDITLYAKWEKDTTPKPDLHYYVEADFPNWLLTDTYKDVSISIKGDRGLGWLYGATLSVEVDRHSAELWYYDSDDGYVDTVHLGQIPGTLDFHGTGITIPLSLYLDRAGTYDFTFTLVAADGTVLATDTATVTAYNETHDDHRIYLDYGRHGSISTSPSTWADYRDTVTIYVKPDKGYELDTLRVYDSDKDRVSVYTNYHDDYVFTMPNSSVTVYATFKEVNYDHFVDVSRDSWYYDAVYYVYDHDIMDGVGSRKFDPYGDLSRAMIVTTLYRMEDEPWVRNYGTFRDVDEDAWYAEAVEWAAEEGIVKGYGKKTFGPNNSVTVEQLAAILQRYADYKGYDIDETVRLYSDAVVSQWAVDNVRWAVAEGLLRDGRSVDSTQVATRAEIAYALYNFMMNVAD